MAEFLPVNLRRDQARQTHHLGQVTRTSAQMQDSLGSIKDSVSELSTNSLVVITCICDLQTATAGVSLEVSALTQVVHANTQAVQANTAALTVGLTGLVPLQICRQELGHPPGLLGGLPACR